MSDFMCVYKNEDELKDEEKEFKMNTKQVKQIHYMCMLDICSNIPIFILKLNIKIGLKQMGENNKGKLCS